MSVTPVTGVCATVLHNVTVVEGIVAAVQGGSLNPITAEAELAQGQQDFVNESQAGGASLRSPLEGLVSAIGEYRDAINQNRSLANSTAQIDQAVAGVKSACG